MGVLRERLAAAPVLCAEGYLFELERRGYLQAGAFVPEVVLEHPEAVLELHREFRRAGSDVMVAFTYYAHREKMRIIGKEALIEPLQTAALQLARQAAEEDGGNLLVAGDICNTNIYDPADKSTHAEVRKMFDEQLRWAADAKVDFVMLETVSFHGEAVIGLEAIKAAGMEAVVNFAVHSEGVHRDGVEVDESCKMLEELGADVVGLNCARGPATMMPLLKKIRAAVSIPVAAVPVPFRTDETHPTFQSLEDQAGDAARPPGMRPFPVALDARTCTRYEMGDFARECAANDINFIGVCCGGAPHHLRAMAEALGRKPEASRYSPDMSKHYALGSHESLKEKNREFVAKL